MKITVEKIKSMKGNEKISMLTAYDYNTARIVDEAGIDIALIGDSLGMVVLGYETTQKVTMQDMIMHTAAVARGIKNAHVVADMPYKSYDNEKDAIKNAKLLVNAGANSVKTEKKPEIAKALVENGVNVMGHTGLTPQTITDFKVQGKDEETARKIKEEAIALEKAGCYALILECVPMSLAKEITKSVSIPTIGIGAGPYCDGQVLVSNDMLGLFTDFKPKFVKRYAELGNEMKKALENYKKDVKEGKFPTDQFSFH